MGHNFKNRPLNFLAKTPDSDVWCHQFSWQAAHPRHPQHFCPQFPLHTDSLASGTIPSPHCPCVQKKEGNEMVEKITLGAVPIQMLNN